MDAKDGKDGSGSMSKVKLVLGAASLFLFIVGVKRSFRDTGAALPEVVDGEEVRASAAERPAQERRRSGSARHDGEERPRQERRSRTAGAREGERRTSPRKP